MGDERRELTTRSRVQTCFSVPDIKTNMSFSFLNFSQMSCAVQTGQIGHFKAVGNLFLLVAERKSKVFFFGDERELNRKRWEEGVRGKDRQS